MSPFEPGTLADRWYRLAMAYPEASATGACVRTAVKIRTKGFIYIGVKPGETSALFKLSASLDEAAALAEAAPTRYQVGKGGWVTVRLAPGESPPAGLMPRWIEESFRLSAPKPVLAAWEAARGG